MAAEDQGKAVFFTTSFRKYSDHPSVVKMNPACVGHQLACGDSSWCPELESRTTHRHRLTATL